MNKIIIITLFFLVSLTWGTTWIAMKITVETIPPLLATGIRFLIVSPLLIIFSYFSNTPLLFPHGQRFFQFVISIFYFSIPFTLMLYGGNYVSSSISSLIFSTMPVLILIISYMYLKKKIHFIQKIGIYISLITLFLILLIDLQKKHFFHWKGVLSLILALLMHAIIYVKCQKKCCNVSVITFNALPSLISGVLLSTISWFVESPCINCFSNQSILAIFYLSIFSGIFGILSYFYLQKKVSSFYASTVFLIFPLISNLLDNYLYKKTILLQELWFIVPLFLGILLTLIPINCLNIFKGYLK